MDADITLADDIVQRNNNDEDVNWLAKRAEGKLHNKKRNEILKALGLSGKAFGVCTGNTYKGLFGKTCSSLKKEKGLAPTQNLRDGMDATELTLVSFAEIAQSRKMVKEYINDGKQAKPEPAYYKLSYDVSKQVKNFLDNI